jgi:hypothetical protein
MFPTSESSVILFERILLIPGMNTFKVLVIEISSAQIAKE